MILTNFTRVRHDQILFQSDPQSDQILTGTSILFLAKSRCDCDRIVDHFFGDLIGKGLWKLRSFFWNTELILCYLGYFRLNLWSTLCLLHCNRHKLYYIATFFVPYQSMIRNKLPSINDWKRIGKGSPIMNGSWSFFQIHWIVNGS